MSKLAELLKQFNIEPTLTKILLFKQWAKGCMAKEGMFPSPLAQSGYDQAREETLENIEEG